MKQKLYRFAGLEFCISMPEDMMYEGDYWLAPFAVEQVEEPHCFRFQRVDALDAPTGDCISRQPNVWTFAQANRTARYLGAVSDCWENAHTRVADDGKEHSVSVKKQIFPGAVNVSAVLDVMDAKHLIVQNNGVLLHCAYIEWNGKAILFTAPCQTGKTTQAELWKRFRGADIINGDRAVIRIADNRILAEGLPFCGTSQYSQARSLPLEAIVYLGQASVTSIRRLRGYEAFARIWEGVAVDNWNKADLEQASETVETIVRRIPIYHMPCTPDENAVEVLEQVLRKQEKL